MTFQLSAGTRTVASAVQHAAGSGDRRDVHRIFFRVDRLYIVVMQENMLAQAE